jgi:hypothetical protein
MWRVTQPLSGCSSLWKARKYFPQSSQDSFFLSAIWIRVMRLAAISVPLVPRAILCASETRIGASIVLGNTMLSGVHHN